MRAQGVYLGTRLAHWVSTARVSAPTSEGLALRRSAWERRRALMASYDLPIARRSAQTLRKGSTSSTRPTEGRSGQSAVARRRAEFGSGIGDGVGVGRLKNWKGARRRCGSHGHGSGDPTVARRQRSPTPFRERDGAPIHPPGDAIRPRSSPPPPPKKVSHPPPRLILRVGAGPLAPTRGSDRFGRSEFLGATEP